MTAYRFEESTLVKSFGFKLLLAAATIAAGLASPTLGQDIAPMVMVPDHPGGVAVNGCFRANETLFGPYRLTFCFERRGTYSVRGGGARCDGRMDWHVSGRDIFMDLHRTSCGNRQAWEAASIDCRPTASVMGTLSGVLAGDMRSIRALRCTYHPTVAGVSRRTFTATRF